MYRLSRLMLIAALALFASCLVQATILFIKQEIPPDNQAMVSAILIVTPIAILMRKKARRIFTSGGTAAWATLQELQWVQMIGASKGLILGRVPSAGTALGSAVKSLCNFHLPAKDACLAFALNLSPRQRKQGLLVRLPQAVHTMVVAPTSVGKGVSCILPFLLTCEESCVVVDFKGENALLTAEQRRRMGHKIIILDPFNVVTPSKKLKRRSDTFNPLDFIAPNHPLTLDECRDMAEALVIRTGEEKDPHWNDKAESVIANLTAVTAIYGDKAKGTRSLQDVRDILAHPQKLEIAKQLMLEHGSILARGGGELADLRGEERAGVLSTCHRHLRFLDTQAVATSTRASSFDPAWLRKGNMTIYLVLPPEHLRAQSALLRVWIGSMFRAVVKGGLQEKHKVHFILDEAAALGHMPALDDAVDKYRAYGVRCQFYYQSCGQLKKCWPHDQGQTLLSNTTKVFFGCNDYQTAEFISRSLGNETIVVESGGQNSGWSRNHGSSSGSGYSQSSGSSYSGGGSSNWQQMSRELLKPDEVMQLDPRIAITLTPGVRPIWTRLIRYYEEKALLKRRGWLMRLATATWTLWFSATLLFLAITATLALNDDHSTVFKQQQQPLMLPPMNPPSLWSHPGLAPSQGTRPNNDVPLRSNHNAVIEQQQQHQMLPPIVPPPIPPHPGSAPGQRIRPNYDLPVRPNPLEQRNSNHDTTRA